MKLSNGDVDVILGELLGSDAPALLAVQPLDFLDDFLGAIEVPQVVPAAAAPAKAPRAAAPAKTPREAAGAPPSGDLTKADSKAAADRFTLSSIKEHAKKKGMWAGALAPVAIPDLLGAIATEPRRDEGGDPAGPAGTAGPAGVELVDIARAHTPALLKVYDEIVVNATDHAKAHERAPPAQRVARIDIEFDRQTGRLTVSNDGPGIPVVRHEAASQQAGRPVYVPEVAFSWFLAGSNIEKEPSSVKGGVNGLGAKLAAVHSAELEVETVDGGTRRYYRQAFRDRLDTIGPPLVVPLARAGDCPEAGAPLWASRAHEGIAVKPHTTVSFVPAYAELGYRLAAGGLLAAADAADLDAWLRLRAHQAAAYVGPRVAVAYNGARCATTDAGGLARLLLTALGDDAAQAIVLTAQAKAAEDPYSRHPWHVAVVVLPPGRRAGRRAAAQNMTVINGVLSNKGSHVQYLKRALGDAVEDKLRKATGRARAPPKAGTAAAKVLKKTALGKAPPAKAPPADAGGADDKRMSTAETLAGVRLVVCGAIPACGGADWTGQRKDELTVPKATLERYALPAAFLKQVGAAAAERLLLAAQGKAGKIVHDKYTRAHHAGRAATKRYTYLMAAEGDSAMTLLRAGLTQARGKGAAPGSPTLDWCGFISLQGVIVNAAREVKEVETSGGETINVRSAKLQGNKRLLALADAFGLRYDRAYEAPEEQATLHYGVLLLTVDQDLDGTGKIAALVLVWLYLFWPALIREGRVGRFMTPVVRVYPKGGGPPEEFLYEEELRAWLEARPDWAKTHHRPKYYKGLAAHDDGEVKRMFTPEAFRRSIYIYTLDDAAKRLFEVYFGPSAALRKEALVTPVAHLTPAEAAELRRRRQIPVGRVQLDVDTKAYKSDAIKRQIAGGPDGLNPARRKILLGAMRRFASSSAEAKIFQLGGMVADKCFYHHGDASLNGTIIYMAQAFIGARRFPYLTSVGQFGSRHGDKAGSARYISVKLSPLAKVVFPPADRWHLPYVFEDGERAEPQYYLPVVPMTCLESCKSVSEGWNHISYGRDLEATLSVVEAYIAGEPELLAMAERLHAGDLASAGEDLSRLGRLWPLPASTAGYLGEVRRYRGEEYSFGMYEWDGSQRKLTITDLPIGVQTAKYLESLVAPGRTGTANPRAAFLEGVEDYSSPSAVNLVLTLKDGAFEEICAQYGDGGMDPIEDAFLLRASLRPHLNYYGADGSVLEFGDCYLAALLYWAHLRRVAYLARLTREQIVAELRIVEEREILRYIERAPDLRVAELEDEESASAVLQGNEFVPLHTALLHAPEYTPNAKLRELVTGGPGANYDYLLNLRERELVKTAADARRARVEALQRELATVEAQLAEKPIAGSSVWLAELQAFRRAIS